MRTISEIAALEALFDAPVPTSLTKVAPRLTPLYRQWVEASRFCVLSTVGEEGTDGSPRGDDGPVVRVVGDRTLWLPDWRGNNRASSRGLLRSQGERRLQHLERAKHIEVDDEGTLRLFGLSP